MPGLVGIDPSGSGEEDFKFQQRIFAIPLLSPLGKRLGPSFEHTGIPLEFFMPNLVEIGHTRPLKGVLYPSCCTVNFKGKIFLCHFYD